MQELNEFTLKAISNKLNIEIKIYDPLNKNKLPIKKTSKQKTFSIKFEYKGLEHYEIIGIDMIRKSIGDYLELAIKNHCAKYDFLEQNRQCADQLSFIERALNIKYPQEVGYIKKNIGDSSYEKELKKYIEGKILSDNFELARAYDMHMQEFIPYVMEKIKKLKIKSIKG